MRVRKRVITLGLCLGLGVSQFMIHMNNQSIANEIGVQFPGLKNKGITQNETVINIAPKKEQTPEQIYTENVKSMLHITTQDSSGSGIIIDSEGTFVTCFHVIANADVIWAKDNDGGFYKVNGFKYINPLKDIAILTLDTQRKFQPVKLNRSNPKIGEKIYTISNPKDIEFSFSDGIINQISKNDIQFSASVSPGSSGGALLNANGELIGIISSQYYPGEAQNINFALPNEYFISWLNNKTIINHNNYYWTDFVLLNVSEDEFSMLSDYAFNNNQIDLWYKYMRLGFMQKKDTMPPKLYHLNGYLAFIAGYYEDAYMWYQLSYTNNQYKDISALGLTLTCQKVEGAGESCVNKWSKKVSRKLMSEFAKNVVDPTSKCDAINPKKDECDTLLREKTWEFFANKTDFYGWKQEGKN